MRLSLQRRPDPAHDITIDSAFPRVGGGILLLQPLVLAPEALSPFELSSGIYFRHCLPLSLADEAAAGTLRYAASHVSIPDRPASAGHDAVVCFLTLSVVCSGNG